MKIKKALSFVSIFVSAAIITTAPTVVAEDDAMQLSCPSAILMDSSTGTVLYEKDSHSRRPLASVTKIMTMLLAMEAIDDGKLGYDDMITGSAYAKSMGGSTIFLDEGEQLSVRDILKGIAVSSGNDAAVAMAEHIGGSCENFVSMMNERATQLGMADTHFVNCNGLPDEGHYSTAYDIALMSRELMRHDGIFEFTTIWMDSLRGGAFTLSNTNKLIRFYDGATGLKTGSTDEAKFCISATAKRDNMHLIAVVMAAPTSKQRSADASKLLNYGFANYAVIPLAIKGEEAARLHIEKGKDGETPLACAENLDYLCKKGEQPEIEHTPIFEENLCAPCAEGERAGELIIKSGDRELGRCDLIFAENVPRMTYGGIFSAMISKWVRM